MAISLRAESTLASGTRTNSTVTAPAGTAAGDLIVVYLECGGTTLVVPTQPGGWTLLESTSYSAPDPWSVSVQVWIKVWDSASSWTFTHASHATQARVQSWIGVDNSVPSDVAASKAFQNQMTGGSANATAPSITTVTNGARGLLFRGSWDGNAITAPSGWTERYDSPVIWVGDRDWPTAGATGAVVVSAGNGGSDSPWGVIMGALRPAGAGGGTWPITATTVVVSTVSAVLGARLGVSAVTPVVSTTAATIAAQRALTAVTPVVSTVSASIGVISGGTSYPITAVTPVVSTVSANIGLITAPKPITATIPVISTTAANIGTRKSLGGVVIPVVSTTQAVLGARLTITALIPVISAVLAEIEGGQTGPDCWPDMALVPLGRTLRLQESGHSLTLKEDGCRL